MRRRSAVDATGGPVTRRGAPRSSSLAKKVVKTRVAKRPPAQTRAASSPGAKPAGKKLAASAKAKAKGRPGGKPVPAKAVKLDRSGPGPGIPEFELALAAFHKQDWRGAAVRLREVLKRFPGEIELGDRVQAYLRIAERQLEDTRFEPRTADEHYHVGVLRMNSGQFDEAAGFFERSAALDARSDKARYALATVLSLKGDARGALRHLRRAIELNPENKVYAANDSDLELVRDDPEFIELVGRPQPRPGRVRTGPGGDESE
jgi:tetratricopeptide (TPR) repeat protein